MRGVMTPTTTQHPSHGLRPHTTIAVSRRAVAAHRRERRDAAAGDEVVTYEIALARLYEAIITAERWVARRERTLAEYEQRRVAVVRRLSANGMIDRSDAARAH